MGAAGSADGQVKTDRDGGGAKACGGWDEGLTRGEMRWGKGGETVGGKSGLH